MSGFQYGRTLFDNDSEHPEELSFQKGEILIILTTQIEGAAGWWLCKKGGKLGIAPGNFLEKLPSTFTPLKPVTDSKLESVAADRSSRAPSGEYSRPRSQKMFLGEGESQLNVHHRQVEEAYNRLNNHYSDDVLKCDEYDVMNWGSIIRHFWTLCENFSSSVLLFSKFIRISVLETIDENVDFVVVGKLSNKLNNVDRDYQALLSLFKITKLVFNENTAKNVAALVERVEKLPSQVNEIFATLKANKNMFFTEEPPKWAKKGARRQSYEDVDCMDFLTQAIEIRNRNEVNLDAKVSCNSVPSSPNRIVDSSGVKARSRSKSELKTPKLSLPVAKTFLKSQSHSVSSENVSENKRAFSISNSIAKLKIKNNNSGMLKSTKVNKIDISSPSNPKVLQSVSSDFSISNSIAKLKSRSNYGILKSTKVNKTDISSPSNPQVLQSVSSDFSITKARAVTMTIPENMTSSPDLNQSRRRVVDSSDVIMKSADPYHLQTLPLTPGGYEPMRSAVFNTVTPDRTAVEILNTAPRQKSSDASILTELYLQLEQVSSIISSSAQHLRSHLTRTTHNPLVYTPILQNFVTNIYKCVFLIETTKPRISDPSALDKYVLNLTSNATSLIRQCQESLKITPFDAKISSELMGIADKLTNQIKEIGRCVMDLRDDSMSSTEV